MSFIKLQSVVLFIVTADNQRGVSHACCIIDSSIQCTSCTADTKYFILTIVQTDTVVAGSLLLGHLIELTHHKHC